MQPGKPRGCSASLPHGGPVSEGILLGLLVVLEERPVECLDDFQIADPTVEVEVDRAESIIGLEVEVSSVARRLQNDDFIRVGFPEGWRPREGRHSQEAVATS